MGGAQQSAFLMSSQVMRLVHVLLLFDHVQS